MNHFGPGSIICGRSELESQCSFGAGSVVNDGIKIVSEVTIGSLGAVVDDISKKGIYVGVPAKIIKKGS
jgi:acetyltransferase-like isoleucine patch superfamily enzyme